MYPSAVRNCIARWKRVCRKISQQQIIDSHKRVSKSQVINNKPSALSQKANKSKNKSKNSKVTIKNPTLNNPARAEKSHHEKSNKKSNPHLFIKNHRLTTY